MRNMGRLFQYNRFGANTDTDNNKKDNFTQRCLKTKEHQQPPTLAATQFATNCPAYAELYPDYACDDTTMVTETTKTTTSTAAPTMTTKSLELALRKYQQWSSKFLSTTTPTATPAATEAAECVTHLPIVNANNITTSTTTSASQKSPNSCSYSTASSSGYHSRFVALGNSSDATSHLMWQAAQNDREELLVNAGKRPKVYDCMKDFLRRKLFQPRHEQSPQQQHEQQDNDNAPLGKSDTEEDVTSDYDEIDMLDSSYNADEEDASDCSSNCTCTLESDHEQHFIVSAKQSVCNNNGSATPQKSLLSLNCWQHSGRYSDTSSSSSSSSSSNNSSAEEELATQEKDREHYADDSDAGISDCCQLITSDKSSTTAPGRRTKAPKSRSSIRYNLQNDELPELLQSSWYQPRITTKAALERLQQSAPGTFIVRRKSRAYELCLRAEFKVKHYAVEEVADTYRLKGAKKQFTSLKALVTHHSVMAEQLPLTLALPREYSRHNNSSSNSSACGKFSVLGSTKSFRRYNDDFDTYESLQLLGLLQQLQANNADYCHEFS